MLLGERGQPCKGGHCGLGKYARGDVLHLEEHFQLRHLVPVVLTFRLVETRRDYVAWRWGGDESRTQISNKE